MTQTYYPLHTHQDMPTHLDIAKRLVIQRGEASSPLGQYLSKFTSLSTGLRTGFKLYLAGSMVLIYTAFAILSPTLHAAELGRLFFTPKQRAQLEQSQPRNVTPNQTGSSVTVSGIVQKHGGARTVWINGVAQSAGNSDILSPDALAVALPGNPQPIKIKVGERIKLTQPASPLPELQPEPQSEEPSVLKE